MNEVEVESFLTFNSVWTLVTGLQFCHIPPHYTFFHTASTLTLVNIYVGFFMENFNDNIQLLVIKAIEMFYLKQIIRLSESENKVSIDALLEIAIKVKTIRTFSFK